MLIRIIYLSLLSIFVQTYVLGQSSSWENSVIIKSLRIDFELAGNHKHEFACLKNIKQEPYWAGNPNAKTDKNNLGDYRIIVKNKAGKLLYTKGFNSLFREWKTTSEAKRINRSFFHSIQLPFPKDSVSVCILSRQKNNQFEALLELDINPKSYLISREVPHYYDIDIVKYSGNPAKNLDIVFIAEGYTAKQMDKFKKDVRRFEKYIFSVVPFSEFKNKTNIYALLTPSEESNPDIPGKNIYRRTILDASFYTFDSPRYLTVRDTKKMYDIASQVPYDHVYVIVNTDIYGGAGFYNTYTSCASDCKNADKIASHELGHGIIGLADEYYSNSDEISYYYNLDHEPWEANITTLADFSKKWKKHIKYNTPIPTPRTKKYKKVVGVFEGGAYQSKGIYSPMQDCKMKSNRTEKLCPICKDAVRRVIKTYTE